MIHASAQGKPYACFVREDVRIPFMAMPDAIRSLLLLHDAPRDRLSRSVYNIASFNPSAAEIRSAVLSEFRNAAISFAPDDKRQSIVDSWPEDVDDSAARTDWEWEPRLNFEQTFNNYLFPGIKKQYRLEP
jgi:nucleoside-diphosphate-sugar epimerase